MMTEFFLSPVYYKTRKLIRDTRFYTAEAHLDWQKKALADLLAYAFKEIPYYRNECGDLAKEVSPETALELLAAVPMMSKIMIRRELDSLYKPNRLRALKSATIGATSTPMPFYIDRLHTRQKELAFLWDQWSRAGFMPGDTVASFTGHTSPPGKLYSINRLNHMVVFSSFDVVLENIREIVNILNHIKPLFFHGYPSVIATLANLMKKRGEQLDFAPEAVFCGSEKMFPLQRQLIEEAFHTQVYTWYGHSEYAVLGGECEHSSHFHLFPQYGYVEFHDTGIPHESGKTLYEIVATGFNNRIMPFIRYRTGDYAVIADDNACACGRVYPMIEEVVGQAQEFLVDQDGNVVSLAALRAHFEKLPYIDDLYFFQERPGQFDFFILPSRKPYSEEISALEDVVRQMTRGRLRPKVHLTHEVPVTPVGKRKLVDQKLDVASYI